MTEPETADPVAPVQTVSCPTRWFLDPLHKKIKGVVRPCTALTRRKEIVLTVSLPRDCFETFMSPLTETDAEGLRRDATTTQLISTSKTSALLYFTYDIKRGSVADRLFSLDSLDPPPKLAAPAEVVEVGMEEGVHEVEIIREKRTRKKKIEYLVKWRDWPESTNTWEPAAHINMSDIALFEGLPPPPPPPLPPQPKRGIGSARARLSAAEQQRGAVPETISMICGKVRVEYKVSRKDSYMPVLKLIFKVLTMDAKGHITWPTTFTSTEQSAFRMQARALLRKMIDDPENPCDSTMEPAMTGVGSSSVFVPAKKRKLVEAEEA